MLTVSRKELLSKLEPAARVAPTRTPKEILRWVRLTHDGSLLTVVAWDGEVGIRLTLKCEGQPCDFLLPAQHAVAVLKSFTSETVKIDPQPERTHVLGNREKFSFPAMDAAEFPSWEHKGEEVSFRAGAFSGPFKRIRSACADASAQYVWAGVHLDLTDGAYLVACDGSQCAFERIGDHVVNWSGTLQPKFMESAANALVGDFKATLSRSAVQVSDGHATVFGRLVEGQFPRWRLATPETKGGHAAQLDVTVGELLRVSRQALLATDAERSSLRIKVEGGNITFASASSDRGDATVELAIASDAVAESEVNCGKLAGMFAGLDPLDTVHWGFGPMHEFTAGNWCGRLMELQ